MQGHSVSTAIVTDEFDAPWASGARAPSKVFRWAEHRSWWAALHDDAGYLSPLLVLGREAFQPPIAEPIGHGALVGRHRTLSGWSRLLAFVAVPSVRRMQDRRTPERDLSRWIVAAGKRLPRNMPTFAVTVPPPPAAEPH